MQTTTNRLWGVHDVAKYLGVPVKTIYQWRQHNYGPKGRRVGRYLRYDPREVIEWFTTLDDIS
ncbi:MAG: helix-turn-helix transcriptional regulator [Pseudonocardiaceae bacterium]